MEENVNYQEWIDKINKAAGVTEEAIVKEVTKEEKALQKAVASPKFWKGFLISFGIFCAAILPRLFFIFFVSGTQNAGIGWYNDSYHHWQIAYLTQQIGLHKEFLRLWDLQGLEYFWGFLQPFLLATLYTVLGTADILVDRLLNVFLGGVSIVLLFHLVKRSFSWQVALATALFAIGNPVGIFTDTSGMQEPLAIFLFLSGIYFWPKKSWLTSLFWLLAALTRGEYWVFTTILVMFVVVFTKEQRKRIGLLFPYVTGILIYMKYLLDKTSNAIYPIYWNFLGNAAGKWQKDIPLTIEQMHIKLIFLLIAVVGSIAGLYILWKRPRLWTFSLLGIGNFLFLSLFIGFTQYLKSYIPRFWVDRIFWLPYIWLGFVVAVVLLYFLPKYLKNLGVVLGWLGVFAIILGLQLIWQSITFYRQWQDHGVLQQQMTTAAEAMSVYKGGSVLIPGNDPIFTYALYKNGLTGANIRGQMFDPFYYIGSHPFDNWSENRATVMDFFQKENIKLLLIGDKGENYLKLVKVEPSHFILLGKAGSFTVYSVH